MINEAALAHLENNILVSVNDSCIAYSKSNISLLNVSSIELRKSLKYPMVTDPISHIGEETCMEIARTEQKVITIVKY